MFNELILPLLLLIPFVGFLISLFIPYHQEKTLSRIAFLASGISLLSGIIYVIFWLIQPNDHVFINEWSIFQSHDFSFNLALYFDKVSAVYLITGGSLMFLITSYSRYYLHRENGYKRFFSTIQIFYFGYNVTILSGNFETLFFGWELLGLSSFLLVGFYHDRYLPVKNSVRVFSIYRIGDVGIILAMWASHHLWHENVSFNTFNDEALVNHQLQLHEGTGLFISFMVLIAAAAKSAQLPFSSWLPRAMEGPTPSSAIFYGSLSVHIGAFLLMRTFPLWENETAVRIAVMALGGLTAIVAGLIARVQPTIKGQIAYASIAQIGIIFIEIGTGFLTLGLIHFAGNAFLRTYQLLVSPSIVSYTIRQQFYASTPKRRKWSRFLPDRINKTIFTLSLREFNLDIILNQIIFKPMKKIGRLMDFINLNNLFYIFIPLYIVAILLHLNADEISSTLHSWIAIAFAFIGFMLVLKAFTESKQPGLSWILIILNHLWIALAISFNQHFDFTHILMYLSGVVVFGIIGFSCLSRLRLTEFANFNLDQYYGHIYEHPKMAILFLISCLGIMGFPISPTFIGEDLIFSHINENQFLLSLFNSLGFIVGGITLIRIYARLFLGPHIKTYHETAYKSS